MKKATQKPIINKAKKGKERVMVVARKAIFENKIWYGISSENLQKNLNLIYRNHQFIARIDAEENPVYKQIIPYLIFENAGKVFLMRRKQDHTDSRLSSKYSLGIGGHINKTDLSEKPDLLSWAKREFEEEISYHGKFETEFLGILNDDSNEVGLVHLGLVIRIMGETNNIKVRDEHKLGKLVSLEQAGNYYLRMETWSQIVYDFLMTKSKNRGKANNVSGVLPDWLIANYIEKGLIKIEPLDRDWRKKIDQVSIDFHLGTNIKLFRGGTYRFIDTKRGLPEDAMEEINLEDGDPFILEPGAFAITSTSEFLKLPSDILGRLEGKSSLARLGILVHSTAARFDPGWNGAPVLELGNLGPKPAILYCGMPICAFTFERLAAPVKMPYEGSRSDRYSGSRIALASRIEKSVRRKK